MDLAISSSNSGIILAGLDHLESFDHPSHHGPSEALQSSLLPAIAGFYIITSSLDTINALAGFKPGKHLLLWSRSSYYKWENCSRKLSHKNCVKSGVLFNPHLVEITTRCHNNAGSDARIRGNDSLFIEPLRSHSRPILSSHIRNVLVPFSVERTSKVRTTFNIPHHISGAPNRSSRTFKDC